MSKILVSTITVFGIELIVNWPDILGILESEKVTAIFGKFGRISSSERSLSGCTTVFQLGLLLFIH